MWKLEEAIFKIGPKKKKDRDVKQGSPASQDFSLPKLGPPAALQGFRYTPSIYGPVFLGPASEKFGAVSSHRGPFFLVVSVVGSRVWIPKLPAILLTRVPPGDFKVRSPQLARKLGFLCAALSCRGSRAGETGEENPDYYNAGVGDSSGSA